MKLLNRSLVLLSVTFFLIIGVWSIIFYFNLKDEIRDSIDDGLENNRLLILQKVMVDSTLLFQNDFGGNNFKVNPISKEEAFKYRDEYKDTMMYRLNENDLEPVRVLHSAFEHLDKYYSLTVISSLVEEDDLTEDSFWSVVWLFVILITSVVLINNLILRKIWNPFYEILNRLKTYRLDQDEIPKDVETNTKEFIQLQEASNILFRSAKDSYASQKQFTANASHELQTPIAIMTNKLELLLESENLNEKDAKTIDEVISMANRLKKLNQTLLLMVKIENKQFLNNELVSINQLVQEITSNYQELSSFKNIEFEFHQTDELSVLMNPSLAEILISNLIRNAIFHNVQDGKINIKITNQEFQISNSSTTKQLDSKIIFNPFEKDQTSKHQTGLGLGLAICRSICKSYGYQISYQFNENQHVFKIQFKKSDSIL